MKIGSNIAILNHSQNISTAKLIFFNRRGAESAEKEKDLIYDYYMYDELMVISQDLS
jgi:hypothetical protein